MITDHREKEEETHREDCGDRIADTGVIGRRIADGRDRRAAAYAKGYGEPRRAEDSGRVSESKKAKGKKQKSEGSGRKSDSLGAF